MIQVTFLGTSAAVPTVERNVAALMLQREGESLLFDCGEGTQRQLMRYGAGFTINDVFFTHFHADHILGLSGLLRTMGLQGRTAPLHLYGPRGAARQLSPLILLGMERPRFPVEIHDLSPDQVCARGDYAIVTAPAAHRGECLAYALVEEERLGRFDPDHARELGIPEGPLWGRLHRGETVTLADGRTIAPTELVGAPRSGRRVVVSGDTAPSPAIVALAQGADLLIHEATFAEDERERARETRHSTAREAAEVAARAGVRRLALTHVSARYSQNSSGLLEEARAVFDETVVARDGMVIEVPYRER
jgi:ribonuclease Z